MKPMAKIQNFALTKRKEKKKQIVYVAKSYHQVTWTQKQDKKEKVRVNFSFSNFLKLK